MLTLLIGNKNLSSWSMRPWLLLKQAGIPFEERVFLFEEDGWREKIVSLSPSRRVPALRDSSSGQGDGLAIWDSLAICEYIAELHPELQLWPDDRAARAVARAVSAEMHSSFSSLRNAMSMDVTARFPRPQMSVETKSDIDRVAAIWQECRTRFGSANANASGPFLFGQFSVADAMFAPVVWRFRSYDVPFNGSEAREWYEMMLALPSMKTWEQEAAEEVQKIKADVQRRSAGATSTTPDPTSAQHCFAVIFTSKLTPIAKERGYDSDAARMEELASKDPGFLGIESARGEDGFGVTISYWDSLEAITRWRTHEDHQKVQSRGREVYYERYEIRVCHVERGNKFSLD